MVAEVLEEDCYESCCSPNKAVAVQSLRAEPDLSQARAHVLDCPILVTERLVLRPPHMEDVDAIACLANNFRIAEMLAHMPHPYTRENAVDFVERSRKGEMGNCIYAITQSDTGIFMGCCGIHPHDEELEIGYWLGEAFWGSGYATEVSHALIDLAFRVTTIERLHVNCCVSNAASRRVIHKCGFRFSAPGMGVSMVASNVPIEHYVLDRQAWIGLRS